MHRKLNYNYFKKITNSNSVIGDKEFENNRGYVTLEMSQNL